METAGVRRQRSAFTLVELLVVIGILSVLAGISLPVFNRAKRSAKQSACLSNVRQLGAAIAIYQGFYDGYFPNAVNPVDRAEPQGWSSQPAWEAEIPSMPLFRDVMLPYVKDPEVFHCPLDNGTNISDDSKGDTFVSSPSLFLQYGSSYDYRSLVAFEQLADTAFRAPASVPVLNDATGAWHGGRPLVVSDFDDMDRVLSVERDFRYNTLFADSHAMLLTYDQIEAAELITP